MTEVHLIEYSLVISCFLFGCAHEQNPVLPSSFLDFRVIRIKACSHRLLKLLQDFIRYHNNEFHSSKILCNYLNNFWHKSKQLHLRHILCWGGCCLITGHIHFYDTELGNEDREVECRICQPVGTFICHIDDLDVSDSITVARTSLGPWHSPLAGGVL